ncbi:hypothetical protein PR001_g12760 [Phytophthora rubi]|uniref:PiggyBac transposable element-derived protein domain-containing protein n=1 Tax=Phytophthora rubi TaxID=129364 RepID=A0A6A3M6V8_9STRA|nr:hypothetical protein PR001_g12760 [Phytophthora rubi]
MYAFEKSFQQIWRELTKKGWTYKRFTGLSNDQRYLSPGGTWRRLLCCLLRYCRRQGWLAFGQPTATAGTALTATATAATATATAATVTVTAATPIATAATVTATAATPTATAATATVTAATATATAATTTATPTMTDPPLAQAAAKRPAATKPKQAAKATPETLRSSSPRTVVAPAKVARAPRAASKATRGRATAKRKATTPRAPSKRRKNEDDTEPIVTEVQNTPRRVPEIPTAVPLDDFDSDNFLDALRRDRLFTPADADDLNVGEADWLLSLDSDVEGDEETILLDEAEGADKDDSVEADVEDDESNHDGNAEEEAPLEFDLSDDELNRLQANGWDTFDEHHSNQVLHDAAPLYEGPWGPTHAVLAYAENPLALFYFFLPKELWRKVAEETNNYRNESIDEIAQGMRARARARRETTPSTIVLSVEEYKAKLRRNNPIQPHEIVRFIGLLVARALERRRESLNRHWVTKVEGALSRGTFAQFLSRDRFQDIARFLHFNDNSKQAESGDRAFKIHPVIQALQKTFFRGYRLGARISIDEGMVPMRHRRNPMRQFMAMKSNKWGTKFYMTCCADTA